MQNALCEQSTQEAGQLHLQKARLHDAQTKPNLYPGMSTGVSPSRPEASTSTAATELGIDCYFSCHTALQEPRLQQKLVQQARSARWMHLQGTQTAARYTLGLVNDISGPGFSDAEGLECSALEPR